MCQEKENKNRDQVIVFYKETLCVLVKFTFRQKAVLQFPVQQIRFDIKEHKNEEITIPKFDAFQPGM